MLYKIYIQYTTLQGVFTQSPEFPPQPSTDKSAIHSESSEPSGSKDEFPHTQTQPPTDASAAVFQNINIRLQSIETNMILLMSKCIINEAEPAELLSKENTTTSILSENTDILNFDTLMLPCHSSHTSNIFMMTAISYAKRVRLI